MRPERSRGLRGAAAEAGGLLLALLFGLPLWWLFVASLRPASLPPPTTIEWVPRPSGWSNYVELFRLIPVALFVKNSLWVELLAVPVTVVVASWSGLAMRFASPAWQRRLIVLAILIMLVPATALWLTRFLLFKQLGLIDTHVALAAPALAATQSFYVLLFYWAFLRVPRDLFDAARLEGAGTLSLWATVALPLSRPAVVTVGILAFCSYWSDLTAPLLYLKSADRYTLPVGIEMLRQMDTIHWPLLLAGCVVMILPVLLLFLALQRALSLGGHLFENFMRARETERS